MKRSVLIFGFLVLSILQVQLMAQNNKETEIKSIKDVILKAVDAMYNQGDIEQIRKYYHPGYILFMMKDNYLQYTTLFNRIEYRRRGHEKGEYPAKEKATVKFVTVDVVGTAATVQFHYYRGERQTCEDFMSLYKFKEGWRIVSQTTYHYPEK